MKLSFDLFNYAGNLTPQFSTNLWIFNFSRLVLQERAAAAGVRVHAQRQPGPAPVPARRPRAAPGAELGEPLRRRRGRRGGAPLRAPRVHAHGAPPRHQGEQRAPGRHLPRPPRRLRPGARAGARQELVHGPGRGRHARLHRARVLGGPQGHAPDGRVRVRRAGDGGGHRPVRAARGPAVPAAVGLGVADARPRRAARRRGPEPRHHGVRRRRGRAAATPRPGVQQPQPLGTAHHAAGAAGPVQGRAAARGAADEAQVRLAAGRGSAVRPERHRDDDDERQRDVVVGDGHAGHLVRQLPAHHRAQQHRRLLPRALLRPLIVLSAGAARVVACNSE
jgi:hypothetical protein